MKIIFLIIFVSIGINLFSQISKNQWLVGGYGTYTYAQGTNDKISSFQIAPSGGFFLWNNIALGARMNFNSVTEHFSDKYRISTLSIGPFFRYYFLDTAHPVNLFVDAAFAFSFGKQKDFIFQNIADYTYSSWSILAGPAFFINKHTALEVTIGYNHSTRGIFDTTGTASLQLGFGLQIHLGK